MATVSEQCTKILAELASIKEMLAKTSSRASAPAAQSDDVASDDLLNRSWADMTIKRDPPRTTQPSHVGKKMSECSPAYLHEYASFYDWKARKGREENPPRLNNKGKPWYESDELIAKVARGWAARNAKKSSSKTKVVATQTELDDAPPDDEEIPF